MHMRTVTHFLTFMDGLSPKKKKITELTYLFNQFAKEGQEAGVGHLG